MNGYWRWVIISTTTFFFFYFKVSIFFFFFFFDVCPSICETQKSFKHKPSFSIELYNMSNMLLKIWSAILLKAQTAATFTYYTFSSFWQLYSVKIIWHCKNVLTVNVETESFGPTLVIHFLMGNKMFSDKNFVRLIYMQ